MTVFASVCLLLSIAALAAGGFAVRRWQPFHVVAPLLTIAMVFLTIAIISFAKAN